MGLRLSSMCHGELMVLEGDPVLGFGVKMCRLGFQVLRMMDGRVCRIESGVIVVGEALKVE